MKTINRVRMWLAGLLLLALIAASCQSSKKSEGPPDGEYSRTNFLLTLEQGRFSIAGDPGEPACEEGSYSIDGDKVTFNTERFDDACKSVCGAHPVYTYHWTVDAETGKLTFNSVDDLCSLRRGDFTGSPLAYKKLSK